MEVENLDWRFVKGELRYEGSLATSKQIAYLERVLGRMMTGDVHGINHFDTGESWCGCLQYLFARIETMYREWETEGLVLSEAEEMVWE